MEPVRRSLARVGEPEGSIVIHAARLFDGLGNSYREGVDIVIDGGRIRAVEAHAERPGAIVIDMGDLAVLPGMVDVQARLPADADETMGPILLAAGVTTIVSEHPDAEHLNTVWSGKDYARATRAACGRLARRQLLRPGRQQYAGARCTFELAPGAPDRL